MQISIENVIIKITQNENNNRFWNPIGMFTNLSQVLRNGVWYNCGISFVEKNFQNYIQISDLIISDENNIIKNHELGLYKEFQISRFKRLFIQLLLNNHSWNFKWFYLRRSIYDRLSTIFVFSFSIILSLIYYIGNEHYKGAWQKYIADNSYIQAFFILLTIFSIGSVFFPFTVQKQLDEADVRKICNEELEKNDKEKETNNRIKERASI